MNNNLNTDIAIIGGGAAGLFCAAMIKSRAPKLRVIILEKQDRVGKKLLVTGNGRCNLTNLYTTAENFHGSFKQGAEKLLSFCPPDMVIALFEEFGLLTTTEDDGRVYPLSKQANSVLDVLRNICSQYGVQTVCDFFVTDITPKASGVTIKASDNRSVFAKKAILSTGSKSSPGTGADDTVFAVLKKLGHKITKLYPSLCPVNVKSPHLKSLKGVRANGCVALYQNDKLIKKEYGEIQFTDTSLSGICVFNLSRFANSLDNCYISVSLLPDKSYDEIVDLLIKKKMVVDGKTKAENFLVGYFNRMIGLALIKEAGISPGCPISDITNAQLRKLAAVISQWKFDVIKGTDFTRSQVTAGGVFGDEIDCETMKSKKIQNLYIIGEAIDCDGDCGGMNLQFAFSSAYCAACDLIQ